MRGLSEHEKILKAEPGTSAIYAEGAGLGNAVALNHVRKLYDAGLVDLVQRRSPKGFQFIIQFRCKPAKIEAHGTFKEAGLIEGQVSSRKIWA